MTAWALIPAGGGSTGVPRKNVRYLGSLPLIAHSIQAAKTVLGNNVAVITDDDEIAEISVHFGARVIREPKTTGKATLDEVVIRTIPELRELGAKSDDVLLTIQPTCPFLTPARIEEALDEFAAGAASVITVVDDRHLGWQIDENGKPTPDYNARVNRQLLPPQFRESGAIIGARIENILEKGTRIIQPIALIELEAKEAIDIDTFADWAVAEHYATRKQIVFRTDASKNLGMGHVYRTLAVAQELARHELVIVLSKDQELGQEFFAEYPFRVELVANDDEFVNFVRGNNTALVILDRLNNDAKIVSDLQTTAKVVTFEDLGEGAAIADLLISDLYLNPAVSADHQLAGVENAILAPTFESLPRKASIEPSVENILLLFGGTDPSNLAVKSLDALEAIGFSGVVTVVRGLGAEPIDLSKYSLKLNPLANVKNMPAVMVQADLALSSAGRTITELACIGVPTICMAQNAKELTHAHTTEANGVKMLGLGNDVSSEKLASEIQSLIADFSKRKTLSSNALEATNTRSNAKVVERILEKLFS
jgi:spore coat polysaccharide biosynthesis predicted glycosyltransferase SpsG/CMP-N-acetylneuraminic acid synthetase